MEIVDSQKLENNFDPVLVYIDETGDHSLNKIDKDFPLFILTTFLVRQSIYVNQVVPKVYQLKIKYFGHEGIILHSRDIRKANPPFEFLLNANKRQAFLDDISTIIDSLNFRLIVSVIKKEILIKTYIRPYNPYELALKFNLERIVALLDQIKQNSVRLIVESRGQKEDDSLRSAFYKIINNGTERVSKAKLAEIQFILTFLSKSANIIGTQFADLCGYPIGRSVLSPGRENKAFDIIEPKIIQKINGWKCFKIFP